MKLYILNPSHQKLQFTFRVPGQRGLRHVAIGPGQQESVYDGSPDDIYNIVGQNEIYGLIEDTDVRAHKGYTGMIFATDRPVDIKSAKIAERQNVSALETKGAEMRKVSAVAAEQVILGKVKDAGFSEATLDSTTIEVRGEDDKGQPAVVNESTTVSKKSKGA